MGCPCSKFFGDIVETPKGAALRERVKPSPLPFVNTIEDVNTLALASLIKHIKDNVEVLVATGTLSLPDEGVPNEGQTWLAIQNSILSSSTKPKLIDQSGSEIIKNMAKQREHPLGKVALWGYGKAFPSNEVVGDLFAKTVLARLLTYSEDSQTYVLDLTVGAPADPRHAQPKWARELLEALDATTYAGTITTFRMQGRQLLPESSDVTIAGATTTVTPADGVAWEHAMTAAVTTAMFMYENFHAVLHLVCAACSTALLTSVPHKNDAHDLTDPLVANVFFTQAQVLALLWGDTGVLVAKPGTRGYVSKSETTYLACSHIVADLARVAGQAAGPAGIGHDAAVDAIMKAFVEPAGRVPAADKALFSPGTKEELSALVTFSNRVEELFKSDPKHDDTHKRLDHSYLNLGPGPEKDKNDGVYSNLGSLGASVACVGIAGGVFHSQTMLTKVFFTPLVATHGTVNLAAHTTLSKDDLDVIGLVFGTIADFNDDNEFGLYQNVGKNNKFYPAVKEFEAAVATIHKNIEAKEENDPPASGVFPAYYQSTPEAVKLGFHNTSTTYV